MSTEKRIQQFNRAVEEMIVGNMQLYSIVENHSFQKLLKLLDSRNTLPTRRTIGRTLTPNLYMSPLSTKLLNLYQMPNIWQ